jgi:hypothetical protein
LLIKKNNNLINGKCIAKEDFEANRLIDLTLNGITLNHADKLNFMVEQNNNRGYFGSLKYALRRFYILLHGKLTIRFENFANEYAEVKPSMPCKLIDIQNIRNELMKGVQE